MKIILPFVLVFFFFRSRYFPSPVQYLPATLFRKLFSICYAVVNLPLSDNANLLATTVAFVLRIFVFARDESRLLFPILLLARRLTFSLIKNVGGLKWTRTIDLTLIRRVL